MFPYLRKPGSLRTVAVSEPSRYSMMSCSIVRPPTSAKPATVVPSISRTKLYCAKGSLRAMRCHSLSQRLRSGGRFPSLLADADDDEFGRFDRSDADLDDHSTIVDVVLCHRDVVADVHEEGLFLLQPGQCAGTPDGDQEVGDRLL